MADLVGTGSVRGNRLVPADMQIAFQRRVDATVSKTVNLPADATVEDVRRIYLEAWRAGAKGITVYRYGSKP